MQFHCYSILYICESKNLKLYLKNLTFQMIFSNISLDFFDDSTDFTDFLCIFHSHKKIL